MADLRERQGRYADAMPLYPRAAAIRETALGATHPDTATSLSNLAFLYQAQARTADALPLVEKTLSSGRAQLRATLPVLLAAQHQQIIPAEQARDEALSAVQAGNRSSASPAVNKLAVRFQPPRASPQGDNRIPRRSSASDPDFFALR